MSDVRSRPTIEVTRHHVMQGVRGAAQSCPIALAIGDVFEGRVGVKVNGDEVELRYYESARPTVMTLVYATAMGAVFVDQFDQLGQALLSPNSGWTFPLTIALEEYPDD